MIKKFSLGLLAVFAPVAAFAQELSTTTGNQINDDFLSGISGMMYHFLPEILGLVAVLVGIGWGVRKLMRHGSGRKF